MSVTGGGLQALVWALLGVPFWGWAQAGSDLDHCPGVRQVPPPQLNLGVHPLLCDTVEGAAGHHTLWVLLTVVSSQEDHGWALSSNCSGACFLLQAVSPEPPVSASGSSSKFRSVRENIRAPVRIGLLGTNPSLPPDPDLMLVQLPVLSLQGRSRDLLAQDSSTLGCPRTSVL